MTEKRYTLKQAAARLGVHERTVRRRVVDGTIPASTEPAKHGSYDQYFISEADLSAYEAKVNKPTYDDLAKQAKALHRELLRLVNRVEAGNVNDSDVKRARRALGDEGE